MQRLPTGYSGRVLAVFTVLAAAAVVGCSDTRPTEGARATGGTDYTTYTYEGLGTRGGTNVDGAGPGGPRDPYRYTTPSPNAPPPAQYVAPDGTLRPR